MASSQVAHPTDGVENLAHSSSPGHFGLPWVAGYELEGPAAHRSE